MLSGDQTYSLTPPARTSTIGFHRTVLLDAAGNTLASDSGGGGYDAQYNVQSSVRAQLPAGTYRLQLLSDLPSGGNYSLQFLSQTQRKT